MAPAVTTYESRDPSRTVLYQVIAEHLETLLASLAADPEANGLPAYVQREFYDYLQCGILAHGFLRMGDWNPILALGTAPGTGVSSGYDDVSILSTGLTAPDCRDHP